MSTANRDRGLAMARCSVCDHDLEARRDGEVYCTNTTCPYHAEPYPRRRSEQRGKVRPER